MDISVQCCLIVSVCVSLSASVISGLRCYNFIDTYTPGRSRRPDQTNTPEVTAGTCPPPSPQGGPKCMRLEVTVDAGGASKMELHIYDCIEVSVHKEDGCVTLNDSDKAEFSTKWRIHIKSLDGIACTCSQDLCNKLTSRTSGSLTSRTSGSMTSRNSGSLTSRTFGSDVPHNILGLLVLFSLLVCSQLF